MKQITKTIIHSSKYLNKNKFNTLKSIDAHVLCLKNNMSQFIYEHILELNNSNVLSFANKYYKQYKSEYLSIYITAKQKNKFNTTIIQYKYKGKY